MIQETAMPRPPRIWYPGALYHVMARGDNREAIFFASPDYRTYLFMLRRALRRYDGRLLAYALMTNHVHLFVETGQTHPVSKIMQSINTAYTFYMHRRYKRVGHIFQGRFHAILVEKDSYALEVTRYIHLNPVRAGMVRRPEDYRWSSYRAYLGMVAEPFVESRTILDMISASGAQRQQYAEFVRDRLQEELTAQMLQRCWVLGSPAFVSRITAGARPPARDLVLSV